MRHRLVSFALLAPASALVSPAAVYAADYLSFDEAQAALFPEADRFEVREVALAAGDRAALKERLGLPVREKWLVRVAFKAGKPVGAVIIDDVIGKFDRITFAAGSGEDGASRQVEILSYRESHGGEVRQASWRSQFAGKTEAAPLRVGEDLSNISGATLSCVHVADGARRSLAVLGALRRAGALK
jgi:hypothetical protein